MGSSSLTRVGNWAPLHWESRGLAAGPPRDPSMGVLRDFCCSCAGLLALMLLRKPLLTNALFVTPGELCLKIWVWSEQWAPNAHSAASVGCHPPTDMTERLTHLPWKWENRSYLKAEGPYWQEGNRDSKTEAEEEQVKIRQGWMWFWISAEKATFKLKENSLDWMEEQ